MSTLRIATVFFLFLLCSCASVLQKVPNNFTPTEKQSIVFGRSEVIHDGKVITYDGDSTEKKTTILHHITKHDINKPPGNELVPGDFMFKAHHEDKGYFAFAVPPGKYYFHELIYMGLIPNAGQNIVFARTYTELPAYELKDLNVIIFEVLPNAATYIGTIRHHCDTKYSNIFASKYKFSFNVADGFDDAKEWFTSSRNQVQYPINKQIADIQSLQ